LIKNNLVHHSMVSIVKVEDLLINKAKQALLSFGFSDFCFFVLAKDNELNKKLPSIENIGMRSINRQKYIIASSAKAKNIRSEYFRLYGYYDERIKNNKFEVGPSLWKGIDRGEKTTDCIEEIFDKNNISSAVTWIIDLYSNLIGAYTLMSEKSPSEMERIIATRQTEIEISLKIFGEYFALSHIDSLNPVENFNSIPKKSISVLKLLAEGQSVEQIATQLYMTTNGVSYHVDKLKRIFNSNNRYQLVDKAHRLGLL